MTARLLAAAPPAVDVCHACVTFSAYRADDPLSAVDASVGGFGGETGSAP